MSSSIKVAVRCRPLNSREIARGAKPLIRMQGNQTFIDPPEDVHASSKAIEKETKNFAFDHSYWSAGPKDEPGYASQQTLFDDMGVELLDHAFEGYNTCIFAYGQTGSGKSYSMMGYGADRGIIPLTCSALFDRIKEKTTDLLSYTVEVSFIEIYNEKVRDLLNPKNKGNLKVREHPSMGPYVEDLSRLAVQDFTGMEALMDEGNKARTVAATNMNETSSRSHSVFTILLTQKQKDLETGMEGEKVSRISLVDLAGSERANSTGATGQRLKEGANINKSLTTLGKVIAALAQASTAGPTKGKKKDDFVPYRDSILTWLLKDSLGGNSKTAMIAAISPADYEETLSTLRYADQAKKIKNRAVVNEEPSAKLIRELKEELAMLRSRVSGANHESLYDPAVPAEKQIVTYQTKTGEIRTVTKAELQDQLQASEKLMAQVNTTWEEKLAKTSVIQKEREQALEELGITIEKNLVGVHTPKKMPHLVNLNEDPLMSECLIYQIKQGRTTVGNLDSETAADIKLSGSNILPEHCYFENNDGVVVLHAKPDSTCMINGQRIPVDKPRALKSGYRVILGDHHVFRFNHPEEVRKQRDKVRSSMSISMTAEQLRSPGLGFGGDDASGANSPATRPDSPVSSMSVVEGADWSYARREAVVARLGGTEVDLDNLPDEELNRLLADVNKARSMRRGGTSVGRPESRMSFLESVDENDDDDSGGSPSTRPFSGSTWHTDDTSLDSTLTFNGTNNPEVDERLEAVKEEMQTQLEAQRTEYEDRIKDLAQTAVEMDDFKAEKQQMEDKLMLVKSEMQRTLDVQRAHYEHKLKKLVGKGLPSETASEVDFEFVVFSEEQLRLLRLTLARWRSHKRVRMAEDALSKAVLLKEANVISREFDKRVTYQFAIVDRDGVVSGSALETISGLVELDDVSDAGLASAQKPCVAIKIVDRKHKSLYVWSTDKLYQRVQQMQNLNKYMNTEYSQHFNFEDPFYEPSPPSFSFVGSAIISLSPLYRNLSSTSNVHIISPFTSEPIGSCKITLSPIRILTSPTASSSTNGGSNGSTSGLPTAGKLAVKVLVEKVRGLSSSEFSSVHCQVRLSDLVGPSITTEEVTPSASIAATADTLGECLLSRTVTVELSPRVKSHLASGYLPIDFFAEIKPAHLDKLERWDAMRDGARPSKLLNGHANGNGDAVAGRRPETELVNEQKHDVMASIELCELAASGEYLPVQVIATNSLDPGAFLLHQGLQRRFILKVVHNSGRGWPWSKISKVELGNVRLLDPKGRMHASSSSQEVELRPIGKPVANFQADGTSSIAFSAAWDSSAHESIFLNRTTASGHRALIRLNWEVEADNCAEPVAFNMDIAVTISGRDARAPLSLMSFLSSSRVLRKNTSLFSVRLTPFMPKKSKDIWRLNTADTQVRGEEVLGTWKPRGVSLIQDHSKQREKQFALADVEATKAILANISSSPPAAVPNQPDTFTEVQAPIAKKALDLWLRRFGTKDDIKLVQEPALGDVRTPAPVVGRKPREKKLMGNVTMVPRTDAAQKRGYLGILRDPSSDRWVKRWVVLRKPYLYQYQASNEVEDIGPINVSQVRIEHSPDMEQMLGRPFVFAMYTAQNAYFVAAQTRREMEDWLDQLDQSWQRQPMPESFSTDRILTLR